MSSGLPAGARLWDAGALALVVAGAALHLRAAAGLREITEHPVAGGTFVDANQAIAHGHGTTGHIGLALIVAGIAVGVVSYFRARRNSSVPTA